MMFREGVFRPEVVIDARAREALMGAVGAATAPVEPAALLLGALRLNDARIVSLIRGALRDGRELGDLDALHGGNGESPANRVQFPVPQEQFSREAVAALEEFEAGQETADGHSLELLMYCLLKQMQQSAPGVESVLDVKAALRELSGHPPAADEPPETSQRGADEEREEADGGERADRGDATEPPRDYFDLDPNLISSVNLTHHMDAAEADIESPFDDREEYDGLFDAICRVLHRRSGHHVLLVGERGVGAGIVVSELARRAAVGRIPLLKDAQVMAVDARLVSPDESRERALMVLSEAADRPDVVLSIDGFASLLRSERNTDNRVVLLSALARVQCRVIAQLTPQEYEEWVADNTDVAEVFSRVDVPEPDVDTAAELVSCFAAGLEQEHGVTIEAEAVRRAVTLSANYILNDQLPLKALKILKRACETADYDRTQLGAERTTITCDDVVQIVSEASGVPAETLHGVAEGVDYEESLRGWIVGQDHAVREVATEIGLIKAGLTDPDKPASVMLFIGQTGTGKTEMAKALARFYSTSKRLRTYTLGNLVEPHSVSAIIGVPPGYVGHDKGGQLVNDLNSDPYCVFLLDEADKAHPDVLQPFLNLFDEGWVRDQRGRQAFASKSIFVMTTNVGQRMIGDMARKGLTLEEMTAKMTESLGQIRHTKSNRPVFTPEFLARIKRIILFQPLTAEAMQGIAQKLIRNMQRTWRVNRGKELDVPEALIEHIATEAHRRNDVAQGREGGRIVRKLAAELIEAPIQRRASAAPQAYRAAERIRLEWVPDEPEDPEESSEQGDEAKQKQPVTGEVRVHLTEVRGDSASGH